MLFLPHHESCLLYVSYICHESCLLYVSYICHESCLLYVDVVSYPSTCAPEVAAEIPLEIGMLLLGTRADPNSLNRFGDPPLSECAMLNRVECALLLLEGSRKVEGK